MGLSKPCPVIVSNRSYALEFGLTVVVVAAIYMFLTDGRPTWFGHGFGEFVGA
jgi:hypothetical protein